MNCRVMARGPASAGRRRGGGKRSSRYSRMATDSQMTRPASSRTGICPNGFNRRNSGPRCAPARTSTSTSSCGMRFSRSTMRTRRGTIEKGCQYRWIMGAFPLTPVSRSFESLQIRRGPLITLRHDLPAHRRLRHIMLTTRPEASCAGIALALILALVAVPVRARADGPRQFVVDAAPLLLGQAADWLDDTHVVWQDPTNRDEDGDGQIQIHRSTLDGAEKVCLTCGLEGPNQVPVAQPHGRWILFHSWSSHTVKVGSPGFGGLGSDVWVMTRDGAQPTNLTHDGELHDNFHAYWSPDGRYIVWTALDWDDAHGGTGKSDVRVARFDPRGPDGPRLVDEHVVRPGNGHWYETQWWAPDGSGFLYTETVDTAINPALFFCRLPDPGRSTCRPVRLTQDPAWDEQAIFTRDMNHILFMSSRNLPGGHNDWAAIATLLGLPAEYDYELILPVFNDSYLQP